MLTKQDYVLGGLIGFFVGIFGMIVLVNVGFRSMAVILALPWVLAVAFTVGVYVGSLLAKRMAIFAQITKFAAVGFLNTAIDFGILNGISLLTGITSGFVVGGVNIPGFVVAMFNGYLWNKMWVFSAQRKSEGLFADFPKFLAVSIGGLIINSLVVIVLSGALESFLSVDSKLALNLAKACATVASMVWNFLGYKFLVFARKEPATPPTRQTPPLQV